MATPVVTNQHATDKPTDESTVGNDPVQYRITIVLGGTKANVAADWATLLATNFASSSAVMSWDRAV